MLVRVVMQGMRHIRAPFFWLFYNRLFTLLLHFHLHQSFHLFKLISTLALLRIFLLGPEKKEGLQTAEQFEMQYLPPYQGDLSGKSWDTPLPPCSISQEYQNASESNRVWRNFPSWVRHTFTLALLLVNLFHLRLAADSGKTINPMLMKRVRCIFM